MGVNFVRFILFIVVSGTIGAFFLFIFHLREFFHQGQYKSVILVVWLMLALGGSFYLVLSKLIPMCEF